MGYLKNENKAKTVLEALEDYYLNRIRHNLEEFSDCCKPIYENVSRIIDMVRSKLESKKD